MRALEAARSRVARSIDFSEEEIGEAKATLLRLMRATMVVRGTETDPKTGKRVYIEVTNDPIQLAAAIKVLEFGIGKPTQMVVVDQAANRRPARADLGKLLTQNPALIESVMRSIKEAAEQAQAIPVQGVASDPSTSGQESES
jgi:hypothetical protein